MRPLSGGSERRLGGVSGARQRHRAGDNPAAEHPRLALGRLVEDAGLSGGNAVFTVDQFDFKTMRAVQPGSLWRAHRADLDVDFAMTADRFVDRAIAQPVHIAQANAAGPQCFARADHNPAQRRIETHDIERRTGGNAKPAALTDGKMNNALMAAEYAALEIDDLAGPGGARTQPFDHIGIAAVGHKTDVLAVLFVGDGEPEPASQFARLCFGTIAQREAQQIELCARRREQEIALVALGFTGAVERAAAVGEPARGNIMAGRQYRGAELARGHQQIAKLDRLIAFDAWHRSFAGDVAFREPVDDRFFEPPLVVEHVVRNADPRRHGARVVNIATGAAGTFAMRRRAMVVELERDADNVIAL